MLWNAPKLPVCLDKIQPINVSQNAPIINMVIKLEIVLAFPTVLLLAVSFGLHKLLNNCVSLFVRRELGAMFTIDHIAKQCQRIALKENMLIIVLTYAFLFALKIRIILETPALDYVLIVARLSMIVLLMQLLTLIWMQDISMLTILPDFVFTDVLKISDLMDLSETMKLTLVFIGVLMGVGGIGRQITGIAWSFAMLELMQTI